MCIFLWVILLFHSARVFSATVVYTPVHYIQRSDSPFYAGIQSGDIFLQTFEQNTTTPNLTMVNAVLSGLDRYSVDEDDGSISGTPIGRSFVEDPNVPGSAPITFNFSPDTQGRYPRYFGLVLVTATSVDNPSPMAGELLGVRLFDAQLTYQKYFVSTPAVNFALLPNDVFYATFIGVYADEGITQITLDGAHRFDHLQYGYSIPEASSLVTLSAVGLAGLAFRRRRPQVHG